MQETKETRDKLANAINTLRSTGREGEVQGLVSAYKSKYRPTRGQETVQDVSQTFSALGNLPSISSVYEKQKVGFEKDLDPYTAPAYAAMTTPFVYGGNVASEIGKGVVKAVLPQTPQSIPGSTATSFSEQEAKQAMQNFGQTSAGKFVGQVADSPSGAFALSALDFTGAGLASKPAVSATKAVGRGVSDVAQGTADVMTSLGSKVTNAIPEGTKVSASILNRELKLPKVTGANKFKELTGETAGDYLTKKGIYGTQDEIMTKLADDWKNSYTAKKETLAQLPNQYTFQPVRTMLDDLVKWDSEISTPGAPSKFSSKIQELYNKQKTRGLTLSDIDDVQYLHQNTTKLGYNKLINPKQVERATELDKAVRNFIDDKATEQGFTNFRELNKNTQASRFLGNQIEKKLVGEESNNFFGLTDNIFLGASMFEPTALAGLATKKLLSSDRVMGGAAKMFGGKGAPELKAKTNLVDPNWTPEQLQNYFIGSGRQLNPAGKPKTDFFVAPEGSVAGQFDPIGQTKLVQPQGLQKIESIVSYSDTIPQNRTLVDDVVENSKRQTDEAYKLLFPENTAKVNENLKDELFGVSSISRLDDTGKYAWETAQATDDTIKYNQIFKEEIINSKPELKAFFDNSKGDDFVSALSKEGIVPEITQNVKTETLKYSPDLIKVLEDKIAELKATLELPKKEVDIANVAVKTVENNPKIKSEIIKVLDDEKISLEDAVAMLNRIKSEEKLSAFYTDLKQEIMTSLNRKQKANFDNLMNIERAKEFVTLVNNNPIKIPKGSKIGNVIEESGGTLNKTKDIENFETDLSKLTPKQQDRLFLLKNEEELVTEYNKYLETGKKPKGVIGTLFTKMKK